MGRIRSTLSALWLFATVNYLYCDVVTLMDPRMLHAFLTGDVGGMAVTQSFLLAAGVLVEVPMAMILLTRFLGPRSSRWANIGAGTLMTAVQLASLFTKAPAPYYAFFSAVEIATTATIVWLAWRTAGEMLGPVQAPSELDYGDAQPAGAERASHHREDRPQQQHVGPNGA